MRVLIGIILFVLILTRLGKTQDISNDFKSYHTLTLQYKLDKKNRLSLAYTGINDITPYDYNYAQFGLRYRRRLKGKRYINAKLDYISVKQSAMNVFKPFYRMSMGYIVNHRVKKFLLSNAIYGELFLPRFNKYQMRYIYNLDITYKWDMTDWRIRPYMKFKLYYYSRGNYLNYYSDEGDLVARKAPNDIHRWRWHMGFKLKPSKRFYVTLSYFWNEEFNAKINRNSEINIYNRNKTGVRFPFNSYGALALAMTYKIKHKKKKHEEEYHM